jgi:hypothetical protein
MHFYFLFFVMSMFSDSFKKQRVASRIVAFFAVAFFSFSRAYAAINVQVTNPLGATDTLPKLIQQILRVAIQIGFPVLVLAIVYSGFLFIKAQGNKTELETAKKAFTWTVIGGAILLGALAIAELLNATVQQVGAGI